MPDRPYHCNQNRVEYSDKEHHVRSRAIPTRNEGCYNKTGISHYRPFGNVVRLVDFRFHHAKALKCPRDHDTDADFAFTPPPYLNFRWGYFSLCLQYWSQAFLELPTSSMWRLFIIIDILFVIVTNTINTFFAGNFGWSKKRPRHAHVKTGQYIARVNYALKLRQDGQQQDR